MQINRSEYRPSFQASFIKNKQIMDFCKNEINEGRDEELIKSLNDLSNHHKNVVLELSDSPAICEKYIIKNLYNGKTAPFYNLQNLKDLSNIEAPMYKFVFVSEKNITPAKTNKIADAVAGKYFVNSVPDYTIGHKVDKSV